MTTHWLLLVTTTAAVYYIPPVRRFFSYFRSFLTAHSRFLTRSPRAFIGQPNQEYCFKNNTVSPAPPPAAHSSVRTTAASSRGSPFQGTP